MGGTSSGHIPAAKDTAHPPPHRPVPPHRASPPQVARASPSLASFLPFYTRCLQFLTNIGSHVLPQVAVRGSAHTLCAEPLSLLMLLLFSSWEHR